MKFIYEAEWKMEIMGLKLNRTFKNHETKCDWMEMTISYVKMFIADRYSLAYFVSTIKVIRGN